MSKVWAVLLAAGSGSRYGSLKQFDVISNKTFLEHALGNLPDLIDEILVVLPKDQMSRVEELQPNFKLRVCAGGSERYDSVKKALEFISEVSNDNCEIVCIHDVARPFCPREIYIDAIELVQKGDVAVIPILDVEDTIKIVSKSGLVDRTLDRNALKRIQTPQVFNFQVIKDLYEKELDFNKITDDAQLCEKSGIKVKTIKGTKMANKITTIEDKKYFENLIGNNVYVSGLGFDVHPYDDSKSCVLGGLLFDGKGFEGHSDGDVVLHAVSDAILACIGEPDIGTLFSANKVENKNIDSTKILQHVITLAKKQNFLLASLSIIFWGDHPKIGDRRMELIDNIKDYLKEITDDNFNIGFSPKNGEGLGFVGESKGATCWVNASGSKKVND